MCLVSNFMIEIAVDQMISRKIGGIRCLLAFHEENVKGCRGS